MSATTARWLALLASNGSVATYHREAMGTYCPCRTPEGFRDPAWHRLNPLAAVCNEQGILPVVTNFAVKGFIQPANGQQQRGRQAERIAEMFGDVRADDHYGVFPIVWNGNTLDFTDWSSVGEDYIIYDSRRFVVIAADKLADVDGDPNHHWEVALRKVKVERPV